MNANEKVLDVILPLDLTNNNKGQGHKWYSSAKERVKMEQLLIKEGHKRKPFSFPVKLRMTRILGPKQRLWDAPNFWRGNSKQLIDAMVAMGWFKDDNTKWIKEPVEGIQDPSQREIGPAVRVELFRA